MQEYRQPRADAVSRGRRALRVSVAAVVLVLGMGLAAFDAVQAPRARIALPAVAASPTRVTAIFFQALSAKDRRTALSLIGPHDGIEQQTAESWMHDTWSLRDITVDPGSFPGGSDDGPYGNYRQTAEVTLEFTPHWLPWVEPGEDGLSPGPVDWFVTLGQNRPTDRWLVIAEGSGP